MTPVGRNPRSIDEHIAAVASLLRRRTGAGTSVESVAVPQAGGRRLAEEIAAAAPLPRFDDSQMDGFALRAADSPGTLPVAAVIAAGHEPAPLPAGAAAAIMTGAPIPPGADAVVPVEDTGAGRFDVDAVTVPGVPAGRFVRPRGSDIAAGEVVVADRTRLTAGHLGAISAQGRTEVRVRTRPRVLVYAGGDEVVAPGAPLRPGQLHDANLALLAGFLGEVGARVVGARLIDDDAAGFDRRLDADLVACDPDLVLTSGGISAGRFEVVRTVLAARGIEFGSVAMQPGGPQGAGVIDGTTPAVCLPGNPVSTWVSATILLRPALAEVWGTVEPRARRVRLASAATPLPEKVQVRRAVWGAEEPGTVELLPGTSSHLLAEATRADVLVPIPAGTGPVPAGTELCAYEW